MTDIRKETVIIVHGTWAAPKADSTNWYLPSQDSSSSNFVSKLNFELEKQGATARCWAHCKDNDSFFHWSGKNDWIDRSLGASQLAATINRLQSEGWRVHVIAHSHGGNVALEALPSVKPTAASPFGISGTVTTLGTPFIDVMSSIEKRLDRWRKIDAIIAWLTYLIFTGFCLFLAFQVYVKERVPLFEFTQKHFFEGALIASLLLLGPWALFRSRKKGGWKSYWDELSAVNPDRRFILAMNSSMDEAWQLLHHLRTIESPLTPKLGWLSYIWKSWREYLRKSCEVEYVHGAALFTRQPLTTKCVVLFLLLLAFIAPMFALDVSTNSIRIERTYGNYWLRDFLQARNEQPSKELAAAYEQNKRIFESDPDAWIAHQKQFNEEVICDRKAVPRGEVCVGDL